MDNQKPLAVEILAKAMEEKQARIHALESEAFALQVEVDHLLIAIHKLLADGGAVEEQIDNEKAASFAEVQEVAVGDDEEYPAEKFTGMARIEIAVALAKGFDGYLATSAFRRVLSKPGVLKSTRQVGSVASRVLANSDEFTRVWEGLYKLKNYSPNCQVYAGGAVPVGGATQ